MLIAVLPVLWLNRWRLSRTAVEIADPLVRAWATRQVLEQSDSSYHLTISTIRVDAPNRRIAIDTIALSTDTARNARLPRPHPVVAFRFQQCALTGIDLAGLASARGLHAALAACDSVDMSGRLATLPGATVPSATSPDSNNFLRFQGKVDLPSALPYVGIDAISLPHVHLALTVQGADGRRTALAFDSVAIRLDSVRIDPTEPVARRRPLFARDISLRLDRFNGRTPTNAHMALQHLYANLEDGSCRLDSLLYEPPPGKRADSLGFASLRAQHVTLSGVRWNVFLLTGEVAVARLNIDTVSVRITSAPPKRAGAIKDASQPIETSLRAMGRGVRLDSFSATALRFVEAATPTSDSAVTTIRRLSVGHFALDNSEDGWASALPIGPVTLTVDGLLRRSLARDIMVNRLALNAGQKKIVVDSLRAAPSGDDSAFARRNPYRKARLSVIMAHVEARGIDLPAFLRRGALRTSVLDVRGLVVDVMKDKRKPEDPAPNKIRRYPQQVMRDVSAEVQIDTLNGAGLVTYRERDANATNAGTLTFGAIKLRGYNFSTDPKRMTAATPFRLIGDTRLMGAGDMHVEWNVPLLARTFTMTWRGSLGTMNPRAMNGFLPDAVGMRFSGGVFEGATWSATVTNGMAIGKLEPRWHDLRVELPGVARTNSGLFGGLLRGVAKLAANTFGIHGDNDSAGGHRPVDGSITHQWVHDETLPQFIWFQLRDPLLLILKK